MFCSKCGAQNADNSAFCANCGNSLNAPAPQPVQQPVQQPMQQPVQQPMQQPQPQFVPNHMPVAQPYQTAPTKQPMSKGILAAIIISSLVIVAAVAVLLVVLLGGDDKKTDSDRKPAVTTKKSDRDGASGKNNGTTSDDDDDSQLDLDNIFGGEVAVDGTTATTPATEEAPVFSPATEAVDVPVEMPQPEVGGATFYGGCGSFEKIGDIMVEIMEYGNIYLLLDVVPEEVLMYAADGNGYADMWEMLADIERDYWENMERGYVSTFMVDYYSAVDEEFYDLVVDHYADVFGVRVTDVLVLHSYETYGYGGEEQESYTEEYYLIQVDGSWFLDGLGLLL